MNQFTIQSSDTKTILSVVSVFAKLMSSRILEAEDITQEVMLKLHHVKHLVPKTFGPGWLRRVTHNVTSDLYRKLNREVEIDTSTFVDITGGYMDEGVQPRCVNEGPRSYDCDDSSVVEQMLGKLPVKHRQVVMLHAEGFSYEEIARKIGTNIGTVRSRLYYARRNLSKLAPQGNCQ
jgi:RNA polymerase sigma-70 factor (ECF subfamily)